MRIQIPVVVEMTDEQVAVYADEFGLPHPVRAKDVVEDIRTYVIHALQESDAFGGGAADVTIKR